jgi:hypothetical protein
MSENIDNNRAECNSGSAETPADTTTKKQESTFPNTSNTRTASSPDSNFTRKVLWNSVVWPEDDEGFIVIESAFKRTGKATGKPILDKDGKPAIATSRRAFTSIDDALGYVDYARALPNTVSVGVCMSSQSKAGKLRTDTKGREIRAAICSPENSAVGRSLWLDINVSDYPYNSALVGEVCRFTDTVGLPPPSVIVPADGRLHYVWTFKRPLPSAEWNPLACAFEEATKRLGLKCRAGTTDPVHIMPLPSGVVTMMPYPTYDVEPIAAKLAPYQVTVTPPGNAPITSNVASPSNRVADNVPGNYDNCLDILDAQVSEDENIFTKLEGDNVSPLVILRKPVFKRNSRLRLRWDSSLPATSIATVADLMPAADRIEWQQPAKNGTLIRVFPPRPLISDYLCSRRGRFGARPLLGVARVPIMEDNGDIRVVRGYDEQTGLYFDQTVELNIPDDPTPEDMQKAVEKLLYPFRDYLFEDVAKAHATLLALIFSALERPFIRLCPLFLIRGASGSGKGMIIECVGVLVFNTKSPSFIPGETDEEFDKQIPSMLVCSPAMLNIENANNLLIRNNQLCSFITEGAFSFRPFGHNDKNLRIEGRTLIVINGVGPIIAGDMARRVLTIEPLTRSEHPELEKYEFDPVEVVKAQRVELLEAAYTIMRAWRRAGMPDQKLPSDVGSFKEWKRKVRDMVHWLKGVDVVEQFKTNKQEDPFRQNDATLLSALYDWSEGKQFTCGQVTRMYEKVLKDGAFAAASLTTGCVAADPVCVAKADQLERLRDALESTIGRSKITDGKGLIWWLRRRRGLQPGGFVVTVQSDRKHGASVIIECPTP